MPTDPSKIHNNSHELKREIQNYFYYSEYIVSFFKVQMGPIGPIKTSKSYENVFFNLLWQNNTLFDKNYFTFFSKNPSHYINGSNIFMVVLLRNFLKISVITFFCIQKNFIFEIKCFSGKLFGQNSSHWFIAILSYLSTILAYPPIFP